MIRRCARSCWMRCKRVGREGRSVPTKDLRETTLSVEVWVAGTSVDEALARRDQVISHMDRPSIELVGAGFGRFFYELWRLNAGLDPLFGHGDNIADAEFHMA